MPKCIEWADRRVIWSISFQDCWRNNNLHTNDIQCGSFCLFGFFVAVFWRFKLILKKKLCKNKYGINNLLVFFYHIIIVIESGYHNTYIFKVIILWPFVKRHRFLLVKRALLFFFLAWHWSPSFIYEIQSKCELTKKKSERERLKLRLNFWTWIFFLFCWSRLQNLCNGCHECITVVHFLGVFFDNFATHCQTWFQNTLFE